MKKTTISLLSFMAIAVLAVTMFSCSEDPADPPTVTIFASVSGYQVAFTATVENADTYSWDFGDGGTSADQNPVYTYTQSGDFTATCTVSGDGGDATASTSVTIAASKLEMLTGGPAMADGKTWKFSPTSSTGDGIFYADAEMTLQDPVPDGILGLIGIPTEYNDEFIFHHDLDYTHSVGGNDSVVGNIVYAMLNQLGFRATAEDVIVLAPFTPVGGTFTFTEDTDFVIEVTDQDTPEESETITYSNVDVLEVAGGEFVGIMDFTRKYIIFDISVTHVQIGFFISTTQGSNADKPTHFVKMTLIPTI